MFFLVNDMIVPGSSYWNMVFGRQPGEALDDEEGMSDGSPLLRKRGGAGEEAACGGELGAARYIRRRDVGINLLQLVPGT